MIRIFVVLSMSTWMSDFVCHPDASSICILWHLMQQMVGGGKFLQHAMRVFIHVLLRFFFNGDDEDEDVMDGTIRYGKKWCVRGCIVFYRVYRFHKPSVFLN